MFLLRRGLGGFFGFTRRDLRLQDTILGAAVDLLFANAVETRGVATSFGHDFSFVNGKCPGGERYGVKAPSLWTHQGHTRWVNCGAENPPAQNAKRAGTHTSTGALNLILG